MNIIGKKRYLINNLGLFFNRLLKKIIKKIKKLEIIRIVKNSKFDMIYYFVLSLSVLRCNKGYLSL